MGTAELCGAFLYRQNSDVGQGALLNDSTKSEKTSEVISQAGSLKSDFIIHLCISEKHQPDSESASWRERIWCVFSCVRLKCTNSSSEVGKKGQNSAQSALAPQGQWSLESDLHLSEAGFRHLKLCSEGEEMPLWELFIVHLLCSSSRLCLRGFLGEGS